MLTRESGETAKEFEDDVTPFQHLEADSFSELVVFTPRCDDRYRRASFYKHVSIAKSDSPSPHGCSQDCERLRGPIQSVEYAEDRDSKSNTAASYISFN